MRVSPLLLGPNRAIMRTLLPFLTMTLLLAACSNDGSDDATQAPDSSPSAPTTLPTSTLGPSPSPVAEQATATPPPAPTNTIIPSQAPPTETATIMPTVNVGLPDAA